MRWKCEKCGLVLANVTTRRVMCRCGTVSEIFQNGEAFREQNRQLGTFDRDEPISSPYWERDERRAICQGCEHFNAKSARCVHIDLGCSRTYQRVANSTQGRCPKGKWDISRRVWVTNADMAALVPEVAQRLPQDISRVAAMPRSGMMAASYIAAHLHLPLYSLIDGEFVNVGGGSRMMQYVEREGRTLLVDDTMASGQSWKRLIASGFDTTNTLLLSMYCSLECRHIPDFTGKILPLPHLLEWNLFSCGYMDMAGLDMDGIICEDNDGAVDPRPLYLPRNKPCKAIITARPESFRTTTRDWLAKWDVKYDELTMWPGGEHERTLSAVADYKAAACVAAGCAFYVESGVGLANAMRERGIRVLCPEDGWLK